MSGLYDRLRAQIGGDDDDGPSGLTPLDIADLPTQQRQVMFVLLRDPQASTEGITLEALQERMEDIDALADILADLTKNGWLVPYGEPPGIRYKVNLRRKRGGGLEGNLWASLSDHLADDIDEPVEGHPEDRDEDQRQSDFPAMSDW
ncbi:MAG TPA: hypothetical protein VMT34_18410 [Aggregatilineales bacterium]|nr:hypothetical protein [Aggregatilineales bacterium]